MAKKKAVKKRSRPANGKAAKKKRPVKPTSQEVEFIGVPIEREFPTGQMPLFANHFVVQNDGPEFYLMFFQTNPPLIVTDSPADRKRQLEKLESVKSQCVARLVMSADRIPAVVEAMQKTLTGYQKKQEATDATGK